MVSTIRSFTPLSSIAGIAPDRHRSTFIPLHRTQSQTTTNGTAWTDCRPERLLFQPTSSVDRQSVLAVPWSLWESCFLTNPCLEPNDNIWHYIYCIYIYISSHMFEASGHSHPCDTPTGRPPETLLKIFHSEPARPRSKRQTVQSPSVPHHNDVRKSPMMRFFGRKLRKLLLQTTLHRCAKTEVSRHSRTSRPGGRKAPRKGEKAPK